jgi:hypothetical protein
MLAESRLLCIFHRVSELASHVYVSSMPSVEGVSMTSDASQFGLSGTVIPVAVDLEADTLIPEPCLDEDESPAVLPKRSRTVAEEPRKKLAEPNPMFVSLFSGMHSVESDARHVEDLFRRCTCAVCEPSKDAQVITADIHAGLCSVSKFLVEALVNSPTFLQSSQHAARLLRHLCLPDVKRSGDSLFAVQLSEDAEIKLLSVCFRLLLSTRQHDRALGIDCVSRFAEFYCRQQHTRPLDLMIETIKRESRELIDAGLVVIASSSTVGSTVSGKWSGPTSSAVNRGLLPMIKMLFDLIGVDGSRNRSDVVEVCTIAFSKLAVVERLCLPNPPVPKRRFDFGAEFDFVNFPSFYQSQSLLRCTNIIQASTVQFLSSRWHSAHIAQQPKLFGLLDDAFERLSSFVGVTPYQVVQFVEESAGPRLLLELLKPTPHDCLAAFVESFLKRTATVPSLLTNALPVLLPFLFTWKGGAKEELFRLAYVLRYELHRGGVGTVSQTQIGDTDRDFAELSEVDKERLLSALLAPDCGALPFVLARLLLSMQSPEEASSSGKFLGDLTNPDFAELVKSCFQPLLLLLIWQLGESDTAVGGGTCLHQLVCN